MRRIRLERHWVILGIAGALILYGILQGLPDAIACTLEVLGLG
jgi:hypothetical protein